MRTRKRICESFGNGVAILYGGKDGYVTSKYPGRGSRIGSLLFFEYKEALNGAGPKPYIAGPYP